MEDSLTLSSTLKSHKLIESNYNLALKLFVNKNFEKSYGLTSQLYQQGFSDFKNGFITEKLFIKIISLYIIETGVSLTQPGLSDDRKAHTINAIKEEEVLKRLINLYQFEYLIPLEILYNHYLLIISNKELILGADSSWFIKKLGRLYSSINQGPQDDKYLKKLIDLYVFEILPTYDNFDESEIIIREDQLYSTDLESNLAKLKEIKQSKKTKQDAEKKRMKEKQKLEKELKQKELQKQKELEKSQNLNYKSIKEIQKQYSGESSEPRNLPAKTTSQFEEIRKKLMYVYGISKNYLKDNGIVVALVILALVATSKFVNFRKINFKERVRETIKMAFQISYL
ncbi:uncharacterized protein CANTADRAFT_7222 [Suhomyces tanzawaensis NRRL Y-17324]|uniref:Uncharacterized protein n=1 Tax=Suhomyces tanzawaensis NRRL Y-17324 TaxID=984487 RepID=A0A1E4SE13_9ASCO|nr:uncharacterized protein CANTADRAFT_7222 [Suhomyces tanzawaensis NRRL Y-17324]ODV77723.1 hypothetical protein CANTADRAFT_7222 [Suhomyces tanzawaensis NRRL Y-17324]